MHHPLTCCIYAIAIVATWLGIMPNADVIIVVLALGVAVVGVPHGGLDHWTGRRWLAARWGGAWWGLFFPAYLAVAITVGVGWVMAPMLTVILFFMLSAWHFGLDDEVMNDPSKQETKQGASHNEAAWSKHLVAIAVGGIVIWIPSLTRANEMREILATIIPGDMGLSAGGVVSMTQSIAWVLVPVAVLAIANGWLRPHSRGTAMRHTMLAAVCCVAPIMVSFGLYFCLWHSVRGLGELYRQSALSPARFAAAVMPLSALAIGMVVAAAFTWTEGYTLTAEVTRAVFIGLSAMAVPHLLLHGFDRMLASSPATSVPDSRSQYSASNHAELGVES